ncbi:MAG: hypothetical protein KF689_02700 [Gemmatimonadaceae bacterium]|nr:hypothetical protein [Gemmatimonadaceae bacterium]MCW5827640.1 hypothetical protein [Gemmatimonadaceae bacterium]
MRLPAIAVIAALAISCEAPTERQPSIRVRTEAGSYELLRIQVDTVPHTYQVKLIVRLFNDSEHEVRTTVCGSGLTAHPLVRVQSEERPHIAGWGAFKDCADSTHEILGPKSVRTDTITLHSIGAFLYFTSSTAWLEGPHYIHYPTDHGTLISNRFRIR